MAKPRKPGKNEQIAMVAQRLGEIESELDDLAHIVKSKRQRLDLLDAADGVALMVDEVMAAVRR